MEFSPEIWWFIIGVALVIAEMFISGFFVFWFGVSALIVSVLSWSALVMSIPLQIVIWASIGGLVAWVWMRAFNPKEKVSLLGDAALAAVGKHGILIKNSQGETIAEFDEPILGQRQWPIVQNELAEGEKIEVVEVISNRLRVRKRN